MSIERIVVDLGGTPVEIETGRIARQADGSVTVTAGETVVLVTACMAPEPKDAGFMPLTCEYREPAYAAGKIPGGFFRREGRSNEKETLVSRLIDRPVRPLFPEGYQHETQVIATVLSYDGVNEPSPLAIVGASASLYLSKLPFTTPLGGVRVGLVDGKVVINPTKEQMETSTLDLLMAGTDSAIVMVEAGAKEVGEDEVVEALERGHDAIRRIVAAQEELYKRLSPSKFVVKKPELEERWINDANERVGSRLREALHMKPKRASYAAIDATKKALLESYPAEDLAARKSAKSAFDSILEEQFREEILHERRRADGRGFTDIRPISCEVGVLPRSHGSSLFTRGETQALVTATLGTAYDAQKMDWIEGEWTKRFMLHYNFPPFSVGEVKPLRGAGRREIGHGALAERALRPVMPAEESFPYTVRVVSDILESNGSSSMASVCGATLAMMDAGVPLKAPVAGIAMGLVGGEGETPAVLTDIAGQEDHHGDMDFKVAGTRDGITALQMDIKISGLSRDIMKKALLQAKQARMEILEKMMATISTHREEISRHAPRILSFMIPKDKIGAVIGPGGKQIRSIVERTGVKIDIADDGRVTIASPDENAAAMARNIVEELTAEAEIGKNYMGKVVRIMDFGAFVEIIPGIDGLLHISEMADERVEDVRDLVEEGDEVVVKVIDIDQGGRIRLSRRAVLREQAGEGAESPEGATGEGGGEPRAERPREDRGDRGDRPPPRGDRGPRGPRRDDRGPRGRR